MRGAFGTAVLRGAPGGHVAADAPGGTLPRLVGPALADAGAHAAAAQRPGPPSSSAGAGASVEPAARRDPPPTALPPSRATPAVAPGCFQPHLSGPEQPRSTAAAVPSAGATTAPNRGQ